MGIQALDFFIIEFIYVYRQTVHLFRGYFPSTIHSGGERIRTSDTRKGIQSFQDCALDRYATPPL